MADRFLINDADMDGVYNEIPFQDSHSTEVTVRLAEVPFEKTADQTIWFSGELTYFLTINNTGDGSLTNVVITDELDTTMFLYIADSVVVTINGVELPDTDFTASYTAPTLTVTIVPEIAVGSVAVISFRGTKVPE